MSLPGLSGDKNKGTKRKVQVVASIFDPQGYFTPTVLEAKLFIQELWTCKFDRDMELPNEYLKHLLCLSNRVQVNCVSVMHLHKLTLQ